MKTLLIVLVTAFAVGCGGGYGSSTNPPPSGSLTIADLMPTGATAGGASFTLTVNGSGFGSDAVIYFNGASHTSSYVTSGQLTTVITSSDIASGGTDPVYVRSGGVNSNTVNFTVN